MGAILLLLGAAVYLLVRQVLLFGVEEQVQGRAASAARTIEAGGTPSRAEAERLTLEGVFVVVRDEGGGIVASTVESERRELGEGETGEEHAEEDGESGADGVDDPIWRRALESGRPAGGVVDLRSEDSAYLYAVPVRVSGAGVRVVEAGKSLAATHEVLEVFATVLGIALVAALLVSAGGAYVLARAALSPVAAVTDAARRITESDLSRRLPVANPKDEIGRLAATVNNLLARLQSAFVRREEALEGQREALERQRRFVSDAGHELRTPLTSISGYARLLKGWGLEDRQTAREAAGAIEREADRMHHLVEELLALARGDEGVRLRVGRHDLGAVAHEAVEAARTAAGNKVSIKYVSPERPVEAAFDLEAIQSAVSILLDNALKYSAAGGTVSVRVSEDGSRAELEVSDTGIGISDEELPLIFERFYQADPARSQGGAGLGLAIARQIAESHAGEIGVRSRAGEGSAFVLRIPLEGPPQE
jgi:two-component system OmpR family sensor kinase